MNGTLVSIVRVVVSSVEYGWRLRKEVVVVVRGLRRTELRRDKAMMTTAIGGSKMLGFRFVKGWREEQNE